MANRVLIIALETDAHSEERRSFTAARRVIAESPVHRNRVYGVLAKAWADCKDFQVNEVEENLYAISFHSESDLMYVLENAPWSAGGFFFFNVKQWELGMPLDEIDFSLDSYWIQVHGQNVDELTYNSANHEDKWVELKYEKLSNFCYNSSRLGHLDSVCGEEMVMSLKDPNQPIKNPKLRLVFSTPSPPKDNEHLNIEYVGSSSSGLVAGDPMNENPLNAVNLDIIPVHETLFVYFVEIPGDASALFAKGWNMLSPEGCPAKSPWTRLNPLLPLPSPGNVKFPKSGEKKKTLKKGRPVGRKQKVSPGFQIEECQLFIVPIAASGTLFLEEKKLRSEGVGGPPKATGVP
ncbi:hypothetical protein SLEP1_g44421 [Rubroshorea leprosula]|uniref:DUF4283 domain-containing protein n=1 Tax=Rubroshorea leprosula TaxID=152421 RepID=A0AAV5LH32_9ROSI|nr:hypothetical protein SLEP1_g44421 [Rubroshorea leprosula]